MKKRDAERTLKHNGFRQDDRWDHREWWHPDIPGLVIYLDGPRNGNDKKFTIIYKPWKANVSSKKFELITKVLVEN